jgi:hypothetical protein
VRVSVRSPLVAVSSITYSPAASGASDGETQAFGPAEARVGGGLERASRARPTSRRPESRAEQRAVGRHVDQRGHQRGRGAALGQHLHAQDTLPTVTLPAEIITVDDGLPQGMVRAILQDREGYMWFGTKDGLARSDGYGFTVFRHDPHDSTTLAGDHVILLFEDRHGYIWIGVDAMGMDRYDPRTGHFTRVALRAPREHPDIPLFLFSMAEDRDGHVYVLDKWGQVFEVDGAAMVAPALVPLGSDLCGMLPPGPVMELRATPSGDLWFLYHEELVIVTRSQSGRRSIVRHELPAHRVGLDHLEDRYCLLPDTARGLLWMLCPREFQGYDLSTHALRERIELPTPIVGLGGFIIACSPEPQHRSAAVDDGRSVRGPARQLVVRFRRFRRVEVPHHHGSLRTAGAGPKSMARGCRRCGALHRSTGRAGDRAWSCGTPRAHARGISATRGG